MIGALPTTPTNPKSFEDALALIAKLRTENALLKQKLDVLCRRLFGRKSDQVDPRQLQLAIVQLANEPGGAAEPVEMDSGENPLPLPRKRKSKGRKPIPSHLPRRVVTIEPGNAERQCECCGIEKERIGEERSEKLDYIPATFEVVATVRGVWTCTKCHEGVVVAPAPPQAVEKSLAGEGLLAQVVTAKYADHLPLHRLERIFARSGVDIARSTMCGWVADVADALTPVVDSIRSRLLKVSYLQTDDTPVTVLSAGGESFKGRVWTYFDPLARIVVFDATETHEGAGPRAFLQGFSGYLQADAYSGYDALYASGRIVEVGCWAHTRRRFVDAVDTAPEAARMVALIAQLYAIEHTLADADAPTRQRERQARSSAVLARIDEERTRLQVVTLPKSPLGEALRYQDRQRGALGRFLEDGRLLLDNNNAERQLRTVAVGRKNWLFAGSFEGARRAATLYSLVQSCRLAGIDPWAYLRDVLIQVATLVHSRVDELAPDRWAASRAAEVGFVRG